MIKGSGLNLKWFKQAKSGIESHGGVVRNFEEPKGEIEKEIIDDSKPDVSKVKYVREDRKPSPMDPNIESVYRVYSAPDEASAQEFLKNNPVSEDLLYLVVETPNGWFGRDKMGIYPM